MKKYLDERYEEIVTEDQLSAESLSSKYIKPIKGLCVCEYCLQEFKARGQKGHKGPFYLSNPIACDWCDELTEELYIVKKG